LLREGGLAAGLMSGFSIFPQMEKDIREEVLQSARRHRVGPLIGPKTRLRFRVVSSEILRKNASLLFELTGKHGVNDLPLINESREKTIQQVTIANFLEEARGRGQDLVSSLASLQHEIIDKVVLGDVNGSREIINRFLGVILLESGMNFTLLKVRLLELIIIISRAAIEKGISAEGLFGPRYAYLTDINAAASFDDLFWRVAKVLENFTRTVSEEMGRKRWAHTAKMRDYVEKHFASKVSARDMAAAAGVSVSRALHLFKREIGVPFTTYVAKRRIECAKYLLKNSALGIAAVASECGFYDQSHFSKTFSAREGVSPLRFRTQERGP
jgi:two-component system response regulator YesN